LGDGWFPVSHNPAFLLDTTERYAQASARLNQEAEKHGRDGGAIHRAYLPNRPVSSREKVEGDDKRQLFAGTPEAIHGDIATFAAEGVETIIFSVAGRELNEIVDGITWLGKEVLAGYRA
jgi:alkanesulfonate monooxygenase SsuD/methylene tetrahydromethanopterin reductase-like flavin-dependent oxidoreductase (luciferase family)